MWKSQIDLENYITKAGKERAVRTMEKNELNGKAELNPYANVFFKKFTLPLAQLLEEELNKKKPGQNYEAVPSNEACLAVLANRRNGDIGKINLMMQDGVFSEIAQNYDDQN